MASTHPLLILAAGTAVIFCAIIVFRLNAFLALIIAALCGAGFVLSVPVFFDTVFYLLVPLARSTRARTEKEYMKYLMAIAAGAAATHTLVPPTPGPLAVAGLLHVDLGLMMGVGTLVAIPAAVAGLVYASWIDRRLPVPVRPLAGGSLVGTWMNDSGFWVILRMGGLTETETLRSWTPLSAIVGCTAMAATVVLALVLPLSRIG